MKTQIDNTQDLIDSRDIIDRLRQLDAESEDQDEREEYAMLSELAEECEGYAPDWKYGETLIRGTYWVRYVRELLDECGTVPSDLPDFVEIDWIATANNVAADYTTVDFDGVEYYIRAC